MCAGSAVPFRLNPTSLSLAGCPYSPPVFTCRSTGECIPIYFACDGEKDCPDGSDEEQCGMLLSSLYFFWVEIQMCMRKKLLLFTSYHVHKFCVEFSAYFLCYFQLFVYSYASLPRQLFSLLKWTVYSRCVFFSTKVNEFLSLTSVIGLFSSEWVKGDLFAPFLQTTGNVIITQTVLREKMSSRIVVSAWEVNNFVRFHDGTSTNHIYLDF